MFIRTILFVAASITAPAFAQSAGPASPDEPNPASVPMVTASTTSLACYFRKADGTATWYWGLSGSYHWYQLTGSMKTTPYTKLKKFFTDTRKAELDEACKRSKNYYQSKLKGYDLFAYFAADNTFDSNRPIVSHGVELFPQL